MFSRIHDKDPNDHDYTFFDDENKISLNVTGIRNLVSEVSESMQMNILGCKNQGRLQNIDMSKINASNLFISASMESFLCL